MGTDSQRVAERKEDDAGERSTEESKQNHEPEGKQQQPAQTIADRQRSIGTVQRADAGATDVSEDGEDAALTDGTVPHEPGPDRAALSEQYGMAVRDGQETKLQRLEDEFGETRVQRWADEGMTVATMGKPQDIAAFRERQAGRPEEVPTDVERRNEASLQRSAVAAREDGPAGEAGAPDAVRNVVSSPGRSLDEPAQREMESKMGGSFDDVQLHTGPKAAEAADSINARAFTVGNHVAFNRGEYNPDSDSGKRVLAHELAHVRQQTDGRVSMLPKAGPEHPGVDPTTGGVVQRLGTEMVVQPKLEVSSPDDPAEREAERVAEQVMRMDGSGGADAAADDPRASPAKTFDRAIQRSPDSGAEESGGVSRQPVASLSPSAQVMEFIKGREGLPRVGGAFDSQIPKTYPDGSEINFEHDIAPYDDPKGYATIGWGSLIVDRRSCTELRAAGDMPEEYDRGISESRAEELFAQDVQEHADPISDYIEVPLAQHEFDALVSFVFNVGPGWLERGTVPEKVNNGTPEDVAAKLLEYEGQDRRSREAAMFVHGDYNSTYSGGGGGGGGGGGSSGGSGTSDTSGQDTSGGQTHVVQRGETPGAIASQYEGVSAQMVKDANEDKLHDWDGVVGFMAGDTIAIPAADGASSSGEQESESGDSESSGGGSVPAGYLITSLSASEDYNYPGDIANYHGISFDALSEFNASQDNSWNGDPTALGADQEVRVPIEGMVIEGDTGGETESEGEAGGESEQPEPSPTERIGEAEQQWHNGEIGMPDFARSLKPFADSHGDQIIGVIEGIRIDNRDNFSYALANNSSDSELGSFETPLLERMASTLDTWLASPSSWERNEEQRQRVLEVLGSEEETGEQVDQAAEDNAAEVSEEEVGEETGAESGEGEAEPEEGDVDITDRIEDIINDEAGAYQSLAIDIDSQEDPVYVEASYFMSSSSHVTDDQGRLEYEQRELVDNWKAAKFKGDLADITPEEADDQFNFSTPVAVEVGKATPSSLENFIQEAYDEEIIHDYTGDDDPGQEEIQRWIRDVGIGVDCSGLVTHMLNAIRDEMAGDETLPEGAAKRDRHGNVVDQYAEEGEVEVQNRNASTFASTGDEITTIEALEPGHVAVNSRETHVIIAASKSETGEGVYEVKTVESASSANGIREKTEEDVGSLDDIRSGYSWYEVPAIAF